MKLYSYDHCPYCVKARMIFGLRGSIERVTAKVFLLSPVGIEIGSGDGAATTSRPTPFNQS